jgi:hypothetical protein
MTLHAMRFLIDDGVSVQRFITGAEDNSTLFAAEQPLQEQPIRDTPPSF